ncbi:MAG TPA: MFS transporter [Bacteroidales bacterium]|nr:MFS transporter [Bacteroidales bacterium]
MAKFSDTLRIKNIFRSLKYKNYRLFFSGQSVSLIGTWMQRITMPWLVYNMTGSELLLGVVSFAGQLPTFLLAPFAGVLSDRWSKYKALLVTQVISMIQASILAWLALSGTIEIWHIVILSIIMGCINAFDVPSRHSFVIDMVENKEDLGNAIALNSLMFNGARLIGPSVAGILLAATNAGVCFLFNAVSYIFVIASLFFMRVESKGLVPKKKQQIFRELKEGFDYTFGFPPIKHILVLLTVVSLTGMSYQVLMPVYASETLMGDSQTYGFLMGTAGLGALAGAIYLASRTTVLRLGRLIPAAAILLGSGLVILSLSRIIAVAYVLLAFIGMGMMLQSAASNTILQTITDDDKRGRVMSFYTMAIMGTAPFGSLLAGALAKAIGTPWTAFIFGFITIIGGLVFFKKLPELREIVRPVYVKLGILPEVAEGMQKSEEAPQGV